MTHSLFLTFANFWPICPKISILRSSRGWGVLSPDFGLFYCGSLDFLSEGRLGASVFGCIWVSARFCWSACERLLQTRGAGVCSLTPAHLLCRVMKSWDVERSGESKASDSLKCNKVWVFVWGFLFFFPLFFSPFTVTKTPASCGKLLSSSSPKPILSLDCPDKILPQLLGFAMSFEKAKIEFFFFFFCLS